MKKVIFGTCLLLLHGVLLNAQQTDTTLVKTDTLPKYGVLKVMVLDSDTKEPLPDIKIYIKGKRDTVITDSNGKCIYKNILYGKYKVSAEEKGGGYEPFTTKYIDIRKTETGIWIRLVAKPIPGLGHGDMMWPLSTYPNVHIYTPEDIKRYPSKP
ncbi:MAG: hypothetical protein A2509_01230 [Candidatus Edwardsbacteria bacterium RIFOXYD12_FULL_50_11]|uniref:SpaA-like prealbumin fold domain-containing protein n=1 Tax=Candidatus Edwardsbacteria bacterium GWF2_54_11 TaxID=1817851 RepID=A0A1F5RCE5_9BACT|nr:MAG: hypothetical protein A2502_07250 [Candidatus Edwardsbacteria bacterium RifOxyC12_full_54_24]OGF07603.1 MAG: hypothetical protein A2273_03810 [Candidatus Edwardsbacteria bacterium RifOxyA12_full_54_48]OGF09854.1 MAG: hypothetical protein A3K15_10220 [Candidatus Edwardsbacteria bacterium GWE2_54_12]OGF12115.1 MAG: hypothetical protein A2024_03775 [Candidatus Edwardsbacteria bacterium GWF2_54_11]OGF16215.1 MAG: hypothetical protein A2509_01230 [Candidatus Edwardsbacteria bacterium RIFOXYD1